MVHQRKGKEGTLRDHRGRKQSPPPGPVEQRVKTELLKLRNLEEGPTRLKLRGLRRGLGSADPGISELGEGDQAL